MDDPAWPTVPEAVRKRFLTYAAGRWERLPGVYLAGRELAIRLGPRDADDIALILGDACRGLFEELQDSLS